MQIRRVIESIVISGVLLLSGSSIAFAADTDPYVSEDAAAVQTVAADQTDPADPALLTDPADADVFVQAAAVSLEKPVLTSVTPAYKTATLKWNPVKGAKGYEICIKRAPNVKRIVSVGAISEKKLSKLVRGAEYTFKVRAFRTDKGSKTYSKWSAAKSATIWNTDWNALKTKYQKQKNVKELILVMYKGNSVAAFLLYKKDANNNWNKVLQCKAYTGQNGIDKKKEGDRRTPTGEFDITCAFGIKDDPGSLMKYTKVNKHLYWCGDKKYNQMIDIRDVPHKCTGEHLITYTKQYTYAMNIGYNMDCVKGKGSAIFLHSFGNYPYTLGCIAVSESNMIKILQTCENGTRICIYRK